MLTTRSVTCGAVLVSLFAACGPSQRDPNQPDGPYLEVTPGDARLDIINRAPASLTFTVELVDDDGDRDDVTDRAMFYVDSQYGSFVGPTFTAYGGGSGVATVTATVDGVSGDAPVTIYVRESRVDASAPANAADYFTGTENPGMAPAIAYPAPDVIVPANIGEFEVHWNPGGANVYEMALTSAYSDVRVYYGNTNMGAFTPGEWFAAMAGSIEGTLTVRGANMAQPGTFGSSAPQMVKKSNQPIEGGLYYFATQSSQGEAGIWRHDFANPGQPPQPFFTNSMSPNGCVGCHALSRDGSKMSLTFGGDGPASLINTSTRAGTPPNDYWNFATYMPSGNEVVTVYHGQMVLRDANSAAVISNISSNGMYATHPEMNTAGTRLAFTQAQSGYYDFQVYQGSIYTMPYDAGTRQFGAPTPLVVDGSNNFYPSWSPNDEWVLFNRADNGTTTYDEPSASLWVVKADGTVPPVQLAFANSGQGLTNSWARWAPFPQTFGPDNEPVYWVTFSSKRNFGLRGGFGQPQIWMAPFFPNRAAAGLDPSGPPFRLPFQAMDSNNHIAQWTERVVEIE